MHEVVGQFLNASSHTQALAYVRQVGQARVHGLNQACNRGALVQVHQQ